MALTVIVILVALLLFLTAFLLVRTILFTRNSSTVNLTFESSLPPLDQEPQTFAEHLASMIKIETVSHEDVSKDVNANFKIMQSQLAKTYPLAHKLLKKEIVDGYTLLYTWEGQNRDLKPVVFMAHQDVVPADEHTLNQWTYPPFSGKIAEGFIWGRGTMDIKSQLISVFEAVETLIRNKFKPERTILLTFSHNEEVLGTGARAVVEHLKVKGIRVQAVLDEGGSIYDGLIPGVKSLAATIGISEKGYLSLKLTANATGGHSSTPSNATAIGILAKAVTRLEAHRFPHNIKMVKPMFQGLGTSASPLMQLAFANLWLFGGVIIHTLAAKPETDATIRTTTAPTLFHSGVKDNVLPSVAEAVVNFRLLPGETIAEVCEHIRSIINDDRVTFEPMDQKAWEASPLSPVDCKAYQHISSVVREIFPGSAVAPYIMLGGTDSRNFCDVSDNVYRFTPIVVKEEDLNRVHGVNERLEIDALYKMVDTFYRLIPRWASKDM
ncbi:MAG: carboxypeptidase PM20D1 [Chloroflexi bacterium]|nr:MAG: carboxypeptidase PM20D1 [Chloroflexota bacterium]